LFVAALGFCFAGADSIAQPAPHTAYVYPAGGRAGSTFQIVVGGQNLVSISNVFFSGNGMQAKVLEHHRPMNQSTFNELRDRLKVLQDKFQANRRGNPGTNGVWTAADETERNEIQAKILKNPPNRTANPAMIDTVHVQVSIAADAAPGEREIRLATPNALSNPLKFLVGNLPEVTKLAAKPANPDLDKYLERIGGKPAPTGTPKYEAKVTLPAVINGQIMPGGVDRYRFSATRGQQIIIAACARSLIPYLADAVPGWFECVLTVSDARGKELASAGRFRFRPDPVVHFEAPRDGEYVVEIHDSIFRGREDFVYRLTIGQLPFVTGVFPLGGKTGEKIPVTLTGWNLTQTNLTLDLAGAETGVMAAGSGTSINAAPFAVDDLPEIFAGGNNHSIGSAQAIALPVIINGRIGQPGGQAVFKFDGRAGQQVVAEVYARRLDSPLDSMLRLTDAEGKQIAFNDDFEDKGSGLNTHHADSCLTVTLPADGKYFVSLGDMQGRGGPEFAYRLRISEPQPGFELRVVPSSINLRAGMSAPVTVFALRRDGFTNAIELSLKDAPNGFSVSGARIGDGQEKAQFTLKAPPQPAKQPVSVAIEGRAVIGGKTVAHAAAPAEDMMQAFIYRHLVPSRELAVLVAGQPRPFLREAFKIIGGAPVKFTPGGTARVKISGPPNAFSNRFKLELDNAPEGISLATVSPVAGGAELVFACDAEKVKPGSSGNLICAVVANNPAGDKAKKPANQARRAPEVTLPAIPFKVE
jgi:hypothetical protein